MLIIEVIEFALIRVVVLKQDFFGMVLRCHILFGSLLSPDRCCGQCNDGGKLSHYILFVDYLIFKPYSAMRS